MDKKNQETRPNDLKCNICKLPFQTGNGLKVYIDQVNEADLKCKLCIIFGSDLNVMKKPFNVNMSLSLHNVQKHLNKSETIRLILPMLIIEYRPSGGQSPLLSASSCLTVWTCQII